MSTLNAWLDEVRPNPYADQLALGFRQLRFVRPLEQEYRNFFLEQTFDLKRIALLLGLPIWLAFAFLDFHLIASSERWWMLAVRLGVLVLLVVCGLLILQRRHAPAGAAEPGVCQCAGHRRGGGGGHRPPGRPVIPYEGLLLVCMAAYFVVGLRLGEALLVSVLILVAYVALELWAGLPWPRLVNNLLFLVFGNLVGAVGCYLLEFKSREHFLISRLMRVLAEHDSLTGLHNRRSFNRQLGACGGRPSARGCPWRCCCAMSTTSRPTTISTATRAATRPCSGSPRCSRTPRDAAGHGGTPGWRGVRRAPLRHAGGRGAAVR